MVRNTSYAIAIGNIARWGDTDVFPKPIDNHVLADMPDKFTELLRILNRDFSDEIRARPPGGVTAAVPNGYSGFRWATQIDPVWNAYLLALVVNIAEHIESVRVPPESVFSHRVDLRFPDNRLFREDGYSEFTHRSKTLANEYSHVVVTDIADFYARVYHHRLENALLAVPKQGGAAKRIVKVLGAISEGRSYGLPVGGPAARLLAELVLDKSDRALLASRVRFARFADDYRIFANSEDEAYGHLASLADLLLLNEGLGLQKAKTRVMTAAEFLATLDTPGPVTRLSDAELKARELLNFSLRFDPYSADPVADYTELQQAVDSLDIVDLFSVELNKSRVDAQFTKKLLRAVQFARPHIKSAVAESLTLNFPLLAPVFPQVMGAIKGLWSDLSTTCREIVVESISSLLEENSYLLRPGVSRAYVVRVLADSQGDTSESVLARLYTDPHSDIVVRRDIILAMAKRRSLWWLSNLIPKFNSLESPAQRRAFIASTQVMTEEAGYFIKRAQPSFSPLENLTLEWAVTKRKSDDAWFPPI